MHRTVIGHAFAEKKTVRFTAVIKDETGAAIPGASLTTLTLTLYNKADGAIINSRSAGTILNANGGTVDGSGNLALKLSVADMVIMLATQQYESHVALIEWTYNGGADAGGHEIEFPVENLTKVT